MGVMSGKIRLLELWLFAVFISGFLMFLFDVTLWQSMLFSELWMFVANRWSTFCGVARLARCGAVVGDGPVMALSRGWQSWAEGHCGWGRKKKTVGRWGKAHGWHGVGVFAVSARASLFVLLQGAVDLRGSCTVTQTYSMWIFVLLQYVRPLLYGGYR
jgi:hypothetical protein